MKRMNLLYVAAKVEPALAEVVMRSRGLAVTRLIDLNPEEPVWSITHLGTGLAVEKGFTEGAARRLLRRLVRLPIEWEALTFDEVVRLRQNGAALEQVRQQIERARKESAT